MKWKLIGLLQKTLTKQSANQMSNRTYECSFCKRGFCNAQALGGHMNIHHRKDKAKLKKVPKITQSYTSRATVRDTIQSLEVKFIKEKSTKNWPWNLSSEDEIEYTLKVGDGAHVGKLLKMPFFGDITSRIEYQALATGAITQSSGPELDLELRLGQKFPEPSATLATRKFF